MSQSVKGINIISYYFNTLSLSHMYMNAHSNLSTLRVRNSLFILRCISYDVIQLHSERMLLQVIDPSSSTPTTGEAPNPVIFGAKSDSDASIGSSVKILLHGIITLICEVPLV